MEAGPDDDIRDDGPEGDECAGGAVEDEDSPPDTVPDVDPMSIHVWEWEGGPACPS